MNDAPSTRRRNTHMNQGKYHTDIYLRPASAEEAGPFYSQEMEKQDQHLGTVGHLRIDFGSSGQEFWSSWWAHNGNQLNTAEFKSDLQQVVDELRRNGPLKDLKAMQEYCADHGGAIANESESYGFIVEKENYQYCLRCTPLPGHYQGYLYCYDLRQQRMSQKEAPVGRVSYASGEEETFTDAQRYLDTIREELPYQATTGFRYETLTNNPTVRKAVDDLLLDFAGEDNPRRACNYGLTEGGKQALRDAADLDRPHTYAWFVMTDCNTPDEQIHRDLTLEEAVHLYRDSTRPEKRLGVTKDGIATVDFLREANGEQVFFQDHRRMESFRNDPEIFEAVQMIHRELEWSAPAQGMVMGGLK